MERRSSCVEECLETSFSPFPPPLSPLNCSSIILLSSSSVPRYTGFWQSSKKYSNWHLQDLDLKKKHLASWHLPTKSLYFLSPRFDRAAVPPLRLPDFLPDPPLYPSKPPSRSPPSLISAGNQQPSLNFLSPAAINPFATHRATSPRPPFPLHTSLRPLGLSSSWQKRPSRRLRRPRSSMSMFPAPVARGQPRRPRSGSGWSPTKSVCIEHQLPPRLPSAIEMAAHSRWKEGTLCVASRTCVR